MSARVNDPEIVSASRRRNVTHKLIGTRLATLAVTAVGFERRGDGIAVPLWVSAIGFMGRSEAVP